MILKSIKLAFAKKKIEKKSNKNPHKNFTLPVSSVAILLDVENLKFLPKFLELKENILFKNSEINVVLFKNTDANVSDFDGFTFTEKDINILGNIGSPDLIKFAANRIDLLITFAKENNVPVNLLTHSCNANLKVGRHPQNEHFLNLIIRSGDDVELFISELFKCLKQFKTN